MNAMDNDYGAHPSTALNALRRSEEISALANREDGDEPVDVVVIGGGITGVGVALDAVTRGLSTVLVERRDLAFGTSRWSSKLAHGGLRYLAKAEVGVAHNSAVERGVLMERTAPHLIHALPQVAVLGPSTNIIQKVAMRCGFIAGDLLRVTAGTSSRTLPRSRYIGASGTLRLCPQTATEGLRGSWVDYDGQMVDDARLVTAVARTAAAEGARILTYVEALSADGGGVTVRDTLTDRQFRIEAHSVINAAGVWASGLDEGLTIRPARGTHLVVDAETLGNPRGALTVPLPGSVSRYVFMLPAPHGRVYLGLTDEEAPGPVPDVPPTPEEDIDFLLTAINPALERPLTRSDVKGAFTGLRPLLENSESDGSKATSDLSRRLAIIRADNGMWSVVGGKFTEYRLMAEETVDAVVEGNHLSAGPCRTKDTPLVGAPRHRDTTAVSRRDLHGLPQTLVGRFGNEAPAVIEASTVDRPLDLVAPLDVTRAEIEFAFTHEGAITVDDVLERRTRAAMVPEEAEAMRAEVEQILEHVRTRAGV